MLCATISGETTASTMHRGGPCRGGVAKAGRWRSVRPGGEKKATCETFGGRRGHGRLLNPPITFRGHLKPPDIRNKQWKETEIRQLFHPAGGAKENPGSRGAQVPKGQDELKARAPLSGAFRIMHGEAGKLL